MTLRKIVVPNYGEPEGNPTYLVNKKVRRRQEIGHSFHDVMDHGCTSFVCVFIYPCDFGGRSQTK